MKITGWSTQGVTAVAAIEGNRINLQFTGRDGEDRNVFVPRTTIPQLIATLTAVYAKGHKQGRVGETVAPVNLIPIASLNIASSESGRDFVLTIVTPDKLDLRFLMDSNIASLIATGLIETLAKHGISVQHRPSGETKH